MGLSQVQFATEFGFPPATLRNWEQSRSSPDALTRLLLAVLAKPPDAIYRTVAAERECRQQACYSRLETPCSG
ncbi:MAG: hypothetical protein NTY38_07455 [Acidobacteria bacterium]|nr:hypothetical protein [Acidobacteriota bacterium]